MDRLAFGIENIHRIAERKTQVIDQNEVADPLSHSGQVFKHGHSHALQGEIPYGQMKPRSRVTCRLLTTVRRDTLATE